jgi:ABC-type Fe3+-hydroxamate transport system substrate-binding protein
MFRSLIALSLATVATPALALDCPEGQRAFSHPLLRGGEQCVPADPQRVAFVGAEAIPAFLLGVETVTTNVYFDMFLTTHPNAVPTGWRETVVDVGYAPETDPELLATAKPDLIVSADFWDDVNPKYQTIAPTVILELAGAEVDWRDSNDFIAQLFGREAELAAIEAAYDARITDLRARLKGSAPTFSVVQVGESAGELYVNTRLNFGAAIMIEAGFRIVETVLEPAAAATVNNTHWYTLSPERIQDLEADWIVQRPGYSLEAEAEFTASPGWTSLAAVRERRIIRPIDPEGQSWARPNFAFAHLVIDDLYRDALGLTPPPTPNPFAEWMTQ